VHAVHARLVSAGLNPSADLADHIDDLTRVLIMQGAAQFRLEPVLPEPASAPLRLDETARRMAELTRNESDASTFNLWHETLILSPEDRHLLRLLDGTRDRDALLDALLVALRDNRCRSNATASRCPRGRIARLACRAHRRLAAALGGDETAASSFVKLLRCISSRADDCRCAPSNSLSPKRERG
jgi:hypothetical protein